ncbi:MAG: hypothetical protein WC900_07215 [Oscillospiraceae bacterium]|jgi:hypothetical protein
MSVKKYLSGAICTAFLILFAMSISAKGDTQPAFTLTNKSGAKSASGDSFNEAYNLFCEYARAFTYLYVNHDAEISADELLIYNNTLSVRSDDSMQKSLKFTTETSGVYIPQKITLDNISADMNNCVRFFMAELKNSTVYNMGSCETYLKISSDSIIIIDDETVFSGDVVINNNATLTVIFYENASLSAKNITIKSGRIVLSGSGLSDGSAPFVSNIDVDFVSADGYNITKIDDHFHLSVIKEEELLSIPDDESSSTDISSVRDDESSSTDISSVPDDESSSPDISLVPDDESSATDTSSVPDDESSATDISSVPDDESSSTDTSSIADDESSSTDISSVPDDESSSPDTSSVPDDESSLIDISSVPDDESSQPELSASFAIVLADIEQIENADIPTASAQENPDTGRTNAFVGGFIFFAVVGAVAFRKE